MFSTHKLIRSPTFHREPHRIPNPINSDLRRQGLSSIIDITFIVKLSYWLRKLSITSTLDHRCSTTAIHRNTHSIAGARNIRGTGRLLTGRRWTGHVRGRTPVVKWEQVACCLSQTAEQQQFRFIQSEQASHPVTCNVRRLEHIVQIHCSRVDGHSKR